MSTTLASKPTPSAPALALSFVIERDGKQYHAYCPALKGLHVEGISVDEAFLRAVRAAMLYLESLARHGEILSSTSGAVVPRNAVLRRVTIEWPSNRTSGASLRTSRKAISSPRWRATAWEEEVTHGSSERLFVKANPDGTHRRIAIHFHHAKDTMGRGLLTALLEDTDWSEADLIRLKLIKR